MAWTPYKPVRITLEMEEKANEIKKIPLNSLENLKLKQKLLAEYQLLAKKANG